MHFLPRYSSASWVGMRRATVAQARGIEQNIGGASLVILKDAAHLANIEQPAGFNQALLASGIP
jgi:pimeloyl-ACP methyl ester carboxylesterase